MNKIKARTLKGFRDFLGEELQQRKQIMKIFEETFQKYGYEPLETPALEYFDILMGKYGEEEKLVYNFEDFGGRRVAMKYDLTVPTCRVLAQYPNDITLPWKRYQMQPVWRADNTQKGRFREFWQCDADVLGSNEMLVEAEYITMGIEILLKLGFKDFKVRLNNRKILNAIAQYANREDKFEDVVYAIDKWEKRPVEDTVTDLIQRGLTQEEADKIVSCIQLKSIDSIKALDELMSLLKDTKDGLEGINELKEIITLVNNPKYLVYDATIARGLSYYTGPVWEWSITEGGVGSVGGCGRYDNLVASFSGRDIPAAGGSFGIERIIEVMRAKDMLPKVNNKTTVLVTVFNKELASKSFEVANLLRENNIATIVFPEYKSLGKQFQYASKKDIPYAIVIGEDEASADNLTLKDLTTKSQELITKQELLKRLLVS